MSRQTSQSPSSDLVAVTPSDTVPIRAATPGQPVSGSAVPTRGLYVGTTGNVTVITAEGQTVLLTAPILGVIHPVSCTHVKATGTTAGAIVAAF